MFFGSACNTTRVLRRIFLFSCIRYCEYNDTGEKRFETSHRARREWHEIDGNFSFFFTPEKNWHNHPKYRVVLFGDTEKLIRGLFFFFFVIVSKNLSDLRTTKNGINASDVSLKFYDFYTIYEKNNANFTRGPADRRAINKIRAKHIALLRIPEFN